MTHKRWLFSAVCLGGMILLNSWLAFGDMVILKNGQQIQGKLKLEGALGVEQESGITFLPLSKVKDVYIHGRKILFFMEDGNWLECHLLTSDLMVETGGPWQIISVDTIKRIILKQSEETEVELIVQYTKPTRTEKPPTPAAPFPQVSTVPGVPGVIPEEGPKPLSIEPTRRNPSEKMRKLSVSLDMGYTTLLGDDSDILKGGFGYGFSLCYKLFRREHWFIGPDLSFLRSMHTGKGFLSGVTQNLNPLCIGFRTGYEFHYFDLYARAQLGPVFMDSSGGNGGRNDTVLGFQVGSGLDYRIMPWVSVGPELRFTEASGKSSWFSALARLSLRF